MIGPGPAPRSTWPTPSTSSPFYGAVTVSERGQIVIPAAARRDLNLNAGDKLLVLGDPAQGLAFITFDARGKLFAANPLMAQELGPKVEGFAVSWQPGRSAGCKA